MAGLSFLADSYPRDVGALAGLGRIGRGLLPLHDCSSLGKGHRVNFWRCAVLITFYSGTPGSGKSLHVARDIYNRLVYMKKPVIASFDINLDFVSKHGKRRIGEFYYVPLHEMNVEFLYQFAKEHHVYGKEGQTLVVIDECQIIFNPREYSKSDRLEWIKFFTIHRHLGFTFILVSQVDMLVDKQIRNLFEYDVKHRKISNIGLFQFIPIKVFVAVQYWYCVRKRLGAEFFIYQKKYSKIYDSFFTAGTGGGSGEDRPEPLAARR